ncbi:hypothetical protein [Paraglaciecola sp.]|uniref:hypothetical protein n=1 Tax=Paraglaciecola sp. TaxID=1920173 RepID=UPI0030F3D7E6
MRKLTTFIAPALLFLSLSWSAIAQDTHKPLDFVSEQLSVQLLNNVRALSSPELVKAQAEYFRLMYTALVDSGFSKEEALKIVIAMAENK